LFLSLILLGTIRKVTEPKESKGDNKEEPVSSRTREKINKSSDPDEEDISSDSGNEELDEDEEDE